MAHTYHSITHCACGRHSCFGTVLDNTDHVVPSDQFKNSSTKKYMRAYESRT